MRCGNGAMNMQRSQSLELLGWCHRSWLCSHSRRLAAQLDRQGRVETHRRKVVEVLREQFQHLRRDREKSLQGCLAVCCELLHLYFILGQASQCSFLLANLTHGGASPDLTAIPKALAVTLCFFWGKHCVLDANVAEAETRLAFAFAHCPPQFKANRRRILQQLVPCRLRQGRFPSKQLLERHGLSIFVGFARAAATGDVQLFNAEFEKHELYLIKTGTYLVVEKLKLVVYQRLCIQVHKHIGADLKRAGKAEHKQDLRPYEKAFFWQDQCDAAETICILANLIYIGAIRGYLSDEHEKIVFSKDAPFPSPSIWGTKAS